MALTTTASAGVVPPSPPALMPSGLVGESTSTISALNDGSVFERGVPVIDTFQFAPILDQQFGQRLNPSARVTLGTRISSRLYLTYSRTVGPDQSELILIEYEQSDRISWVLSRDNEDRTFALDFRVRYVF